MHPAFAFVYAGLLIIGGVIGFAKSGSVISAVAGVGSGLAIAGVEVAKTSLPSQRTALCATHAVIALMLTFIMYTRWKASGKFMPAGLVMVISGIMSAVFAVSLQSAAGQVDAAAKSK